MNNLKIRIYYFIVNTIKLKTIQKENSIVFKIKTYLEDFYYKVKYTVGNLIFSLFLCIWFVFKFPVYLYLGYKQYMENRND